MSESKKRKDSGGGEDEAFGDNKKQWEDVKKARNRINSQRTRERERLQMETLETDKTRLYLSNDALRFQNDHFREAIQRIREVQRLRQMNGKIGQEGARGIGSLPVLSTVSADMENSLRGRIGLEQNAFLPSQRQEQFYPVLGRDLGQFSSTMPPLGGPTLEDIRIRQRAARDVEAAILRRHRAAAAAGVGGLHPMSQTTLGLSSSGMLPSELMELQARQLRMQELGMGGLGGGGGARMMGQLPRGFHGSAYDSPETVMVRGLREHSHQETKQVDSHQRREKAAKRKGRSKR